MVEAKVVKPMKPLADHYLNYLRLVEIDHYALEAVTNFVLYYLLQVF